MWIFQSNICTTIILKQNIHTTHMAIYSLAASTCIENSNVSFPMSELVAPVA